jgi:hypothetical protein
VLLGDIGPRMNGHRASVATGNSANKDAPSVNASGCRLRSVKSLLALAGAGSVPPTTTRLAETAVKSSARSFATGKALAASSTRNEVPAPRFESHRACVRCASSAYRHRLITGVANGVRPI